MIETAGFGDLDMARLAVLQLQPRNVVAQHPIRFPSVSLLVAPCAFGIFGFEGPHLKMNAVGQGLAPFRFGMAVGGSGGLFGCVLVAHEKIKDSQGTWAP